MNNNILALVFLVAGTLLTIGATTIVPAAYADNSAEDDSLSQRNDCDENDISGDSPNFNDVCQNTGTNTANDS